jgi:hypothetical protein
VRTQHDRAARFERDEDLVDGRRRGIGRRHDRRDHAEGLRDLDDLPFIITMDDADGLHRPDERVDAVGRETVLLNLVGDDAESGFFDGERRQILGVWTHGRRGSIDEAIDLFLRELGERRRREFCARRQTSGRVGGRR